MRRCSLVALGCILAVAPLLSCVDDPFVYVAPTHRVGAIEGIVSVAGEPRQVMVGAREYLGDGAIVAHTQSDERGWYRLELPSGRYRIEVAPDLRSRITARDTDGTVVVTRWAERYDLNMSRVVIRVATPPWMEGFRASTFLESPEDRFLRDLLDGEVKDGLLKITHEYVPAVRLWASVSFGGLGRVWVSGTDDLGQPEMVQVESHRESVLEVSLDGAAAIEGHVGGSWEQVGSYPPDIEAVDPEGGQVSRMRVEEDGSFFLPLLVAQPVLLRLDRYPMPDLWLGGDRESATVLTPDSLQILTGITIEEGAIQLRLHGPGTFVGHNPGLLLTDGQGWEHEINSFGSRPAIHNLQPGDYYLQVHGTCTNQPWRPTWYGGSTTLEGAAPIRVEAGRATAIDMTLEAGGSIEGQVQLGELPWVRVALFDTLGAAFCSNGTWTEDGTFRFTGLGDGDYLVAVIQNNEPWWFPGTSDLESATRLRIENASTVNGVDWLAAPPQPVGAH